MSDELIALRALRDAVLAEYASLERDVLNDVDHVTSIGTPVNPCEALIALEPFAEQAKVARQLELVE